MKLFVDQNLAEDLTSALSRAGHDAVHAREFGLERATDPEIFKHCCDQQRTLLTADKKLTKFLASSGADCPSVVILRDVRTFRAVEVGRLLVANLPAIESVVAEHGNAVFAIAPSKQIRATILPLGPGSDS